MEVNYEITVDDFKSIYSNPLSKEIDGYEKELAKKQDYIIKWYNRPDLIVEPEVILSPEDMQKFIDDAIKLRDYTDKLKLKLDLEISDAISGIRYGPKPTCIFSCDARLD